jgi:hypothetical protein
VWDRARACPSNLGCSLDVTFGEIGMDNPCLPHDLQLRVNSEFPLSASVYFDVSCFRLQVRVRGVSSGL